MSKNLFLAVNLPSDYHPVWRQDLIRSMSPIDNPGCKGIDISEVKIYQVRVYNHDEKRLLERIKTFNNMDHEGGQFRAWKPGLNRIATALRHFMGLGDVPITPCNPINTPGHILILARTNDRLGANGEELR